MKSVTINGQSYALSVIKLGVGRRIKDQYPDPIQYNTAFVAESLKAGGFAEASAEWLEENCGYFEFNQLVIAAYEANNVVLEKPKPGEGQPPVEAAA